MPPFLLPLLSVGGGGVGGQAMTPPILLFGVILGDALVVLLQMFLLVCLIVCGRIVTDF